MNLSKMNRWYKYGKSLLNEIAESKPQPDEAYIWFTGQHGFIIKISGLVFYIDVILSELLDKEGKSIRVYPPPFTPEEAQNVDFMLCSHNHIDHLDFDTLLPLAKTNSNTQFIVPAPCKNALIKEGIQENRILQAKVGENLNFDSVTIKPIPAFHTQQNQEEGEIDENGDYLSLGFILQTKYISIYHSGDTWMTQSLLAELQKAGRIDLAMLPINGTDWQRTSQGLIGNMGYLDAVKLAETLDIDLVIPAHYDLIAHNSENPANFAYQMYTRCPQKRFHICAPGERFVYKKE